jgi:hypothetical protein
VGEEARRCNGPPPAGGRGGGVGGGWRGGGWEGESGVCLGFLVRATLLYPPSPGMRVG